MNDPSQQHIGTPALIRRFAPYLMRYKRILIFDLFCAALTTLCDIVLPKIMSYLTNAATDPGIVGVGEGGDVGEAVGVAVGSGSMGAVLM